MAGISPVKLTDANVIPIGVIRSKLFSRAGLYGVDPFRQFDISDTFEMGSICRDELCRWDIFHGSACRLFLHC